MFYIDADDFCWINGGFDDPKDLCLHGSAEAVIGDETFKYNCTVSSTVLYLLKSLTQDHIIYKENQMLPCCGHSLFINDDRKTVEVIRCSNGIDWSVIHKDGEIMLVTESGNEVFVDYEDYKRQVFEFADKVEAFYNSCKPKDLSECDNYDKTAYKIFWQEWHYRRNHDY